jgi:ferredoxin
MKIAIDRDTCSVCGTCWESCPDVFEQNPDDSFSQVVEKYRLDGNSAQGMLPPGVSNCAREAADLCPVQIIRIVER